MSCAGLRGAGRSGKWLTSSKSSPNLQVPPSSDIVVLGKECRSRRCLTIADDEATGSNTSLPELKGVHSLLRCVVFASLQLSDSDASEVISF